MRREEGAFGSFWFTFPFSFLCRLKIKKKSIEAKEANSLIAYRPSRKAPSNDPKSDTKTPNKLNYSGPKPSKVVSVALFSFVVCLLYIYLLPLDALVVRILEGDAFESV